METKLYTTYAEWWPLFADPAYYASEASSIVDTLHRNLGRPPQAVLELGCGGGTLTSQLKQHAQVTAVDIEPRMLSLSLRLNPECEHVTEDMRTLRLGKRFDAVILHDAVNHLTTFTDLVRALETAWRHLREEGCVIVLPDDTTESFRETTSVGGRDEAGRGLRYLLWTSPPRDQTYRVDFAILLRENGLVVDVLHESHTFGLFSRKLWCEAFSNAGFPQPTMSRDRLRETVFCAKRRP